MKDKQDSVMTLQRLYQNISIRLARAVENKGAATVKAYQDEINEIVKAAVKAIGVENHSFAYSELGKGFDEGKDRAKSSSQTRETSSVGSSAEISADLGFVYSRSSLNKHTFIQLQAATEGAGKGFLDRLNNVISELKKQGRDTIPNVRSAMVQDMRQNGVLSVEYKSGRKMPLEAYASMAARSARTETENIGAIGWSLKHGVDYVKMTEVYPTCPLCARYQGKVYCISGRDKRFTHLTGPNGPLSKGYALVHPNCRHQFNPYNLAFHTDAEIEKEGRRSLALPKEHSAGEAKKYAEWQAYNRRYNEEMLEFQAMQRHYKQRGETPPYVDIGAFRRSYRSKDPHSLAYARTHYIRQDAAQLELWKSIIPESVPSTLDKFQEMKYNKIREFDFLRQFKETRENKEISQTVSFAQYKKANEELNKRLVGKFTPNGIEIKSISKHLIDRYFGNEAENRKGVSIDDIERVLVSGVEFPAVIDKQGRISKKIKLKGVCSLSYNPDEQKLIQVNPYRGE